ncbi:fibrillarin [Sulfolobales archaeon HS-7]|nr:fibrillarin [Sulfolobales archaeon HS-7]
MSEVVNVQQVMEGIFKCSYNDGTYKLCTKNFAPGHRVYGERLINYDGVEYREWNAFRSKFAGAIMNGLDYSPFRRGSVVLYLGVASGTTASHLSDIVGKEGRIYSVEFSPRVMREFLLVSQHRQNLIPILEDARFPNRYRTMVEEVDVIYIDVAQPNQAEIALNNAKYFLEKGGELLLAVKSRSIDVTKDPQRVFEEESNKLKEGGLNVRRVIDLDPYDKDHAMIVSKYE